MHHTPAACSRADAPALLLLTLNLALPQPLQVKEDDAIVKKTYWMNSFPVSCVGWVGGGKRGTDQAWLRQQPAAAMGCIWTRCQRCLCSLQGDSNNSQGSSACGCCVTPEWLARPAGAPSGALPADPSLCRRSDPRPTHPTHPQPLTWKLVDVNVVRELTPKKPEADVKVVKVVEGDSDSKSGYTADGEAGAGSGSEADASAAIDSEAVAAKSAAGANATAEAKVSGARPLEEVPAQPEEVVVKEKPAQPEEIVVLKEEEAPAHPLLAHFLHPKEPSFKPEVCSCPAPPKPDPEPHPLFIHPWLSHLVKPAATKEGAAEEVEVVRVVEAAANGEGDSGDK